jgi:microcystin-dependent protein
MSDPFIAQIKLFAGNFAPRGYAFCDGQMLSISQHTALFSLLGTTYGGDGRTTFALPDLRSRAPIHEGHGPGLSTRTLGQRGGTETETLSEPKLPSHNHTVKATSDPATDRKGAGKVLANSGSERAYAPVSATPAVNLSTESLKAVGGGQTHDNMRPFIGINHIIALTGTFPSRA